MTDDPALKDAISTAAYRIHAHLMESGKWLEVQTAFAQELGETSRPGILSTHLCRETSMFTRAMLEASGFTGWTIVSGEVDLNDLDKVPEDIEEYWAEHTWLIHEEAGLLLDMTADQFGPDFWHKPEPMLIDARHANNYGPDAKPKNWYDPNFTPAKIVSNWLNLPEGQPATPESRPLARRPEPLSDMLRQASGEALPEKDEAGERLMVLLQMLEEIREEMEPSAGLGMK
jgi:hypothetical protein